MIESSILKMLARQVPNYHTVSPAFLKGTFSVCPCARCENSECATVRNSQHLVCTRVLRQLKELGASEGIAIVAENGTCDAARFIPIDMTNFRLEEETVGQASGQANEGEADND